MDDLISRQAALEKVRTMQTYKLFMGDDMILIDKADVQTELMMLPSVQPEYKLDEWCTDCKEYDHDKHCCPRFNRVIAEAIKEAKENTQPETGRWIEYTRVIIPEPINKWEQAWKCSECGYGGQDCEDGSAWHAWKYCPNCGVKMKGVAT